MEEDEGKEEEEEEEEQEQVEEQQGEKEEEHDESKIVRPIAPTRDGSLGKSSPMLPLPFYTYQDPKFKQETLVVHPRNVRKQKKYKDYFHLSA